MEQLPNAKEPGRYSALATSVGPERWSFDEAEEFFAALPEAEEAALHYEIPLKSPYRSCSLWYFLGQTSSRVHVASEMRSEIHAVMNIFRGSQEQATALHQENSEPETIQEKRFNIFIGHGHSCDWQQLRDHLRDLHQYNIVAFETGARAGHSIRDILEEMLDQSSLAFLVLTGEDETAEERFRARQNVIHETGLFQGRLGFSKAIVLLEKGVEEFSNNAGIQHISFAKGHIEGVFGDVVATIKREMKRKGLETG
jgi:predicted nucleotide-binding protein